MQWECSRPFSSFSLPSGDIPKWLLVIVSADVEAALVHRLRQKKNCRPRYSLIAGVRVLAPSSSFPESFFFWGREKEGSLLLPFPARASEMEAIAVQVEIFT